MCWCLVMLFIFLPDFYQVYKSIYIEREKTHGVGNAFREKTNERGYASVKDSGMMCWCLVVSCLFTAGVLPSVSHQGWLRRARSFHLPPQPRLWRHDLVTPRHFVARWLKWRPLLWHSGVAHSYVPTPRAISCAMLCWCLRGIHVRNMYHVYN